MEASSAPESGYAVFPDTHGRYDLVARAMDFYDLDKITPVFLGDFLDRGTQTKELLNLVRSIGAISVVGNHEWVLRNALADRNDRQSIHCCNVNWPKYEHMTLDSYAITRSRDWHKNRDRLHAVMEETGDLEFLNSLPPYFETDSFIAVHAGPLTQPWSFQTLLLEERSNPLRRLSLNEPPQIFDFKLAGAYEDAWVPKGKKFIKGHTHLRIGSDKRMSRTSVRLGSDLTKGDPLYVWESAADTIREFSQE